MICDGVVCQTKTSFFITQDRRTTNICPSISDGVYFSDKRIQVDGIKIVQQNNRFHDNAY